MTLFDFFLIIILFGAGVLGYKRGIIVQIASLLMTVVGLLIAILYTDELAVKLSDWFSVDSSVAWNERSPISQMTYSVIAFFLLFTLVKLVLSFFTSLFNRLAKFPILKQLNRLGGILLSVLQTLIFFVIIVHILNIVPLEIIQRFVAESIIAQGLISITPYLIEIFSETFLN